MKPAPTCVDYAPIPADSDACLPRRVDPAGSGSAQLVSGGKTDWEIGEELFISVSTKGNHVSNILNKIGAVNRAEAASHANQHGLVTADPTQ